MPQSEARRAICQCPRSRHGLDHRRGLRQRTLDLPRGYGGGDRCDHRRHGGCVGAGRRRSARRPPLPRIRCSAGVLACIPIFAGRRTGHAGEDACATRSPNVGARGRVPVHRDRMSYPQREKSGTVPSEVSGSGRGTDPSGVRRGGRETGLSLRPNLRHRPRPNGIGMRRASGPKMHWRKPLRRK